MSDDDDDTVTTTFSILMTTYKPGPPGKGRGKAPTEIKERKNKELIFELNSDNYDEFLQAIVQLYEWDLELRDKQKPFAFSYYFGPMKYVILPAEATLHTVYSLSSTEFAKP
jgi:hypothetical protein